MTSDDQPVGAVTLEMLGRYQLLTKLGQGGMGAVYLANDAKLDRRVAIKVLPVQSVHDPDAVARFQREGKALAKLAHAGIVQAFDTEEDNGRHFLVMEFVEGKSLADVLKEQGRIPPTRAADYIYQAALALQHAHERGLVHRDLKPSNLLITAQGQVKMLDLGLARFLQDQIADPAQTREGMGLGTPDYAAPEQFRDAHAADARADIYALGCTLYQLLTGRVPFPGSSLSEKYAAHQNKEAAPVEEVCPDAPAGLALVVTRMMAKRPADRFQSARDVADALSPYIAAASGSFARLKSTTTWDHGQLTMREFKPRRRLLPWGIVGAAVAATIVLGVLAWPRLFGTPSAAPESDDDAQAQLEEPKRTPPGPKQEPTKDQPKKEPRKAETAAPDDPDVLTVSKDKKDNGKYRTVGAALKDARPGMTIRILDDAIYRESLMLKRADSLAGVTIEGLRRPTLAVAGKIGIFILDVPGVTLRRLRIRAESPSMNLVLVGHRCPGVTLEQLEMEPGAEEDFQGIDVEDFNLQDQDAPLIIRDCHIRRARLGIRVSGLANDNRSPLPCKRIIIERNSVWDSDYGIGLLGRLHHVQVVANRIWNARRAGVQFDTLLPGSANILLANNTIWKCGVAFRLWDKTVNGEQVRFSNNLVLGSSGPDIQFVEPDQEDPNVVKGPGDVAALLEHWRLDHNWREVKQPTGDDVYSKSWIPPGPAEAKNCIQDTIDVRSREPGSLDFLRPAKDSPLVSKGAGKTDPRLPQYIGAVPPEGVEPWDWDRTWRMPRDAKLLTVSKDKAGGGEFRSIGAALAKAKPWSAIRVLDNKEYEESLVFDRAEQHEGILLESPRGATIKLGDDPAGALVIDDVPNVVVRGFRLSSNSGDGIIPFVTVTSHSPGVVLADLLIQCSRPMARGIVLKGVTSQSNEPPVVVKRCTIEARGRTTQCDGIDVEGLGNGGESVIVAGRISIIDNRITGALRGILIQGRVRDVQVAGNLVWHCRQAAIQLENLTEDSSRILVSNNSAFGCSFGLRVWDSAPFKKHGTGQVEFRGNLLLNANDTDMLWVLDPLDGSEPKPGDGRLLTNSWSFSHNSRDLSGVRSNQAIPLAPGDHQLKGKVDLIRDPSSAYFLRPANSSHLANGGAGKEDPSLPTYVGAVPPEGVPPWDWDRTWQSRLKKPLPKK
jgi:serine/threonine protein kinase